MYLQGMSRREYKSYSSSYNVQLAHDYDADKFDEEHEFGLIEQICGVVQKCL